MSEEFEQQDPRDVAAQEAYVDALTGLPTMSQFFRKEDCEEARLRHMFTAGRALGRREMKGVVEAFAVREREWRLEDAECGGNEVAESTDKLKAEIAAAIEAIPEEV